MSSMEVDVPQMNGFSHNQPRVAKKTVHFGSTTTHTAAAEVAIFSNSATEAKPKHKGRRRARHPSKSDDVDGATPKPISPTKLQKMTEKDRHSRTGVRGLPKKGNTHAFPPFLHLYTPFSMCCVGVWLSQRGLSACLIYKCNVTLNMLFMV